jgi:hypothetical protein
MHAWLLFVHSATRWALLVVAAVTLVVTTRRVGRLWTANDEQLSGALLGLADLQLLLGLALWLFASPLTRVAFDQRLLFSGGAFSFFGLVHPAAMIASWLVLHGTRAVMRRQPPTAPRHARWRAATLTWLVLVVLAIPWPVWSFGRALFRSPP